MQTLRSLLLVVLTVCCASALRAQSYGFGSANMTALKHASYFHLEYLMDHKGDLLLAGTYEDSMDVDPGPGRQYLRSAIRGDFFVQKQDSAGNLVWSFTVGGPGYEAVRGLAVDNQNNVYIAGSFNNTVDFDPGPGVSQLSTGTLPGNFILKLSPQGQFIWVRDIDGNAQVQDLKFDGKGALYTCGVFRFTVDFDPGAAMFDLTSPRGYSIFTQKLDTAGNFIWAKPFNNNVANTYSLSPLHFVMTVDTAGNPVYAGTFSESVDFDPGPADYTLTSGATTSDYRMFVAKLDSLGGFLWARKYARAIPFDWKTDRKNNLVLTCEYEDSTTDFDPDTGVVKLPAITLVNTCILKLSDTGRFVWAVPLVGRNANSARSVNLDSAGNAYICGWADLKFHSSPEQDFDPGTGVRKIPAVGSSGVTYLYGLSSQGRFKSLQYLPSGQSFYRSLAFRDTASLYLLAEVYDSLDCNPGSGVFKTYEQWFGAPSRGYSVIRMNACSGAFTTAAISDSSCSSYRAPSGRYTWTSSGVYRDTIPNTSGCDSLLTITLTIRNSFSNVSVYSCGSYPAPSGKRSWSASGTYTDTLANSRGCDSIITINLSVHDTTVYPVANGLEAASAVGSYQWLDCTNGYAVIPGATSKVFTPVQSGSYAVAISFGACSDTSGCHTITALSAAASASRRPTVSPNPATGPVRIDLPRVEAQLDLEVLSIGGARVRNERFSNRQSIQLDLSALPPGTYILKLKAADWVEVVRLSKE